MITRQFAIIKENNKYIGAVLDNNILDNVLVDDCDKSALKAGDIYICKVQNVVKNINAAFVEIEKNTVCYMSTSGLTGKNAIAQGQEFPVQIKKAAVKTKQAVVSQKLEFSGKYAVVTTVNLSKTISTKITNGAQRQRLDSILQQFNSVNLGIILRTECTQVTDDVIIEECTSLIEEAESLLLKAESRTCFTKIYEAPNEFVTFIMEYGSKSFERIITDDKAMYDLLKSTHDISQENIVLYEDTSYSLDKLLGIHSKLDKMMSKHVWLKSGGSLVIEHTEALSVIDVNTEKAIQGKRNSETTFFKINEEAAIEAARQIRVRNISGIIIIDFIDMKKREQKEKLLEILQTEFRKDSVRTTVVDITKLGLVEITRMKKRKPLWEILS